MAIDNELIVDFIGELFFSESTSFEGHFLVYEKFLLRLGYDGGTYTFLPQLQFEAMKDLPTIFQSTSAYPTGFIKQYTDERLDQSDFTMRKILEGDMAPMDWREYELTGLLSKEEVAVIKLAREAYGINNALSIPIMHEEHGGAGASVISYKPDDAFKTLKNETLESLVAITKLFHGHIFNLEALTDKFIQPILGKLKPNEVIILKYKASGKLMKNIQAETGLSESYASNMLGDLRKKMGGLSTDRLMYLLGLLNTFQGTNGTNH